MRKFMVVLLGFALFLGACVEEGQTEVSRTYQSGSSDTTYLSSGVTRVVDRDAGVICWTTGDSIFCMPISQTKLDTK